MNQLKIFCDNPTKVNFNKVNERIQKMLYKTSKLCIKIQQGNLDLARKILSLYESKIARFNGVIPYEYQDLDAIGLMRKYWRKIPMGRTMGFVLLFLASKHKNDCLLLSPSLKLETIIKEKSPRDIMIEANKFFDESSCSFKQEADIPNKKWNYYLECPSHYHNFITNCLAQKKRFILMSLELYYNIEDINDRVMKYLYGRRYTYKSSVHRIAHANFLIYDSKNFTLERFEPYGYFSAPPPDGNIDKTILQYFQSILKIKKYYKPLDFCPRFSFQTLEEIERRVHLKNFDRKGMCLMWSFLYADFRMSYPNIDPSQLVNSLIQRYLPKRELKSEKEYKMLIREKKKTPFVNFIVSYLNFMFSLIKDLEQSKNPKETLQYYVNLFNG